MKPPTPEQKGSKLLVSTADKCTVAQFECCLIDNNLSVLGNGTKEEREQAWLSIYSDYLQLTNKGKNQTHIRHLAKIYALSAKITMVKCLCEGVLATGMHTFFNSLKDWGYKIEKAEDIKKIIAKLKSDEVELSTMIKNLPKQNGQPISREYFTELICEFEAMQGFPLEKETLMVNKFAQYYCKLIDRIEAAKKK